jgi:hypothetical protein
VVRGSGGLVVRWSGGQVVRGQGKRGRGEEEKRFLFQGLNYPWRITSMVSYFMIQFYKLPASEIHCAF